MAEVVIILFLVLYFLDGELQLALHLPQKHVVDEDVVILLV